MCAISYFHNDLYIISKICYVHVKLVLSKKVSVLFEHMCKILFFFYYSKRSHLEGHDHRRKSYYILLWYNAVIIINFTE